MGNYIYLSGMKIIFLNTWFGKVRKPLTEFLLEHAPTTDVFCFSEISAGEAGLSFGSVTGAQPVGKKFEPLMDSCASDYFFQLKNILVDFDGQFDDSGFIEVPGSKKFPVGLAMFIKKDLKVENSGIAEINNGAADDPEGYERIMQYACVSDGKKNIWINNFHGMSHPFNKLDSEGRLNQSKNILSQLNKENGPIILGGDFNLFPDTESIRMFEKAGYKNLIKEYEVSDTRGELNFSQWPGSKQYFADYVFVSPEISVKNFEVPQISISDHLPLILEIE